MPQVRIAFVCFASLAAGPIGCVGAPTVPSVWPAVAAAERLGLTICERDQIEEPLLCGTVQRPARPSDPDGPTIEIAFVVVPAQDGNPDNLVWTEHQGGPGRTLLSLAGLFASGGPLERFRAGRDLLFVDQRGVGESGGNHCAALATPRVLRPYFTADAVAACRRELEASGAMDMDYSTIAAVDDLEAIRAALGYDRLDLGGWSYGSRYVLTYAHRHPGQVRTISVFVPSPIDYQRPIDWARFSDASLEGLFTDCEAEPACVMAYPSLRADWARLVSRVRTTPPLLTFVNPYTARPDSARLTMARLIDEIHVGLLRVGSRRGLPALIHAAAAEDYAPFLELAVPDDDATVPLAEATYLSIVCPEETAFIDPAEAERRAANTFTGMHFVDEFRMACAIWDLPPHPAYPLELRPSDLPILIVAGGRDPITPIEYGQRIAANFTQATVLAVEGMPHHSTGLPGSAACLDEVLLTFLARGSMAGVDHSCAADLRPPPFDTGKMATDR